MRPAAAALLFLVACVPRASPARLGEDLRDLDATRYRPLTRESVRAVARIQSPELAPLLVEALADPVLRADAAWGIGQLVFGDYWNSELRAGLAAALAPYVDDPDPRVQQRVRVALGRLGEERLLRERLPDAAALEGLFWRAYLDERPLDDATMDAIARCADHSDADVRRRAACVFTRRAEPRARRILERLARDTDPWARMFALRALGRMDDADPAIFAAALRDREVHVRAEAARFAADPLPVTSDSSAHVRAVVAERTGALLYDRSPWVRSLAVAAAARRGGLHAQWLRDPDYRVRAAAAGAIAASGAEWRGWYERAIADTDRRVRMAAIGALAEIADATPEIVRLLRDRRASIEEVGAAVEAASGRDDPQVRDALAACARYCRGSRWVEVREGIVYALARIGAWEEVERLAGDPAPSVRARARMALAAHRGERPQEPRRAVEHPSEHLGAPAARRLVLETERGAIVIELEREWAPTHAAALSSLARAGFYDGLTFHRVVPNFVVQGGDPTGTGWGSAGFTLRDEVSPVAFDRGVVGIAKAGKDTGSCQMFFMLAPAPHLNGRYTVVGRIVEGLEVADALEVGDRILRAYAGE